MKKLLLALMLTLSLAISLVALTSCGGDGNECDHVWAASASTDTAATCTTEGSESIKCLSCGEKKADSVTAIPATGHNYTTDAYTAPTCITAGSETKICADCGDSTTETLPATGEHIWDVFATIDVEATCTTDGSRSVKCSVCLAVKPDSEEIIPAGHVWGIIATTDTPATCTTDGVKTIKCIMCQEKQAGTEEVIPATGHSEFTITVVPTLYSEGLAEGTCTVCGTSGSAVVPKTTVTTYSSLTNGGEIRESYAFDTVLNDGETHFYPTEDDPDGNALYVEYSFLWNPTLIDIKDGYGYMTSPRIEGQNNNEYDAPFWINLKEDERLSWSDHPGSFEYIGDSVVLYGPPMDAEGLPKEDYPNFGEFGWHRIGIEMKETVTVEGTNVQKKMIVTLFIDGVKTSVIDMQIRYSHNWLYTATLEDGELVYEDIPLGASVLPYYFPWLRTESGDASYVVIADVHITAGDGFVLDVTPVTNPEEVTYELADGVSVPGNVYFAFASND